MSAIILDLLDTRYASCDALERLAKMWGAV